MTASTIASRRDESDIESGTALKTKSIVILWCIVVAGLYFRLSGVQRNAFWEDEWWTIWRTEGSLFNTIYLLRSSPFPPLHYLLVWAWRNIWNGDIFSIRCVSLVAGIAGIASIVTVWRKVLPAQATMWTAAVVSFSGFHMYYSLDAKMYSAVWLYSTAGGGLYLYCILKNPRSQHFFALGLVNGCAVATSYVGVISLGIQGLFGLYLFALRPQYRRKLASCLFATVLSLMPLVFWIDFALRAATHQTAGTWMPAAELQMLPVDVFRLISLWLCGVWMGHGVPRDVWSWIFLVTVPVTFVFSVTLACRVAVFRRYWPNSGCSHRVLPASDEKIVLSFLVLWLCFPIFAAAVFSLTVYSLWGVPRYLIGCSPALPILVAYAIATDPKRGLAVGTGILILVTNGLAIQFGLTQVIRSPMDRISNSVRIASAASDPKESVNVAHVSLDGRYMNPMLLQAELDRVDLPFPSKIFPVSIENMDEYDQIFVIIQSSGTGSRFKEAVKYLVQDRECVLVDRVKASEELFSKLPGPFDCALTEVWLCR